jgi:hypothetical protein
MNAAKIAAKLSKAQREAVRELMKQAFMSGYRFALPRMNADECWNALLLRQEWDIACHTILQAKETTDDR